MSGLTVSHLAIYTTLVLVSGSLAYWAGYERGGQQVNLGKRPSSEPEDDSEDEDGKGEISSLPSNEDCKLVLVVRSDLGMSSGKIAAQCSHATLACYKTMVKSNLKLLRVWENAGQPKIALKCRDEDELLLLEAQAQSLNLVARSIQDAGRTQVAAGSRTVLGVAGPVRMVNMVTGNLKLL